MTALVEPREKVCGFIKDKTGLDEDHVNDLELGIYNWCIEFCDSKRIFKSWKNPRFSMTYMEKVRSILSNIDPECYIGNKSLIQKLNEKEFMPHEVAFMRPDVLFPEKWKDTSDEFNKKFAHAYENRLESMTDDVRCGRCKGKKIVYHEVFSRSADEGAVQHFRCIECSNSWKMS